MNKKYFFFDIDGTLAVGIPGNQYVPESAKEAIKKLEGIDCRGKGTSCPDQLSKALVEYKNTNK